MRVPFGPLYASELARAYGYDTAFYESQLDRMLMYLARYGHQDASSMERNVATRTLVSWTRELGGYIEQENQNQKGR